jgi:hypothetical protein
VLASGARWGIVFVLITVVVVGTILIRRGAADVAVASRS